MTLIILQYFACFNLSITGLALLRSLVSDRYLTVRWSVRKLCIRKSWRTFPPKYEPSSSHNDS